MRHKNKIVNLKDALKFYFTRGPSALLVFSSTATIFRIYLRNWNLVEGVIVTIFFVGWGIFEWSFHKYVLHGESLPYLLNGIIIKTPFIKAHQEHHNYPDKIDGIFFKFKNACFGLIILYCILYLIFYNHELTLTIFACFTFNVARYEWFHLMAHSHILFKSRWINRVIYNHRLHHTHNMKKFYGVSSALGDKVF